MIFFCEQRGSSEMQVMWRQWLKGGSPEKKGVEETGDGGDVFSVYLRQDSCGLLYHMIIFFVD